MARGRDTSTDVEDPLHRDFSAAPSTAPPSPLAIALAGAWLSNLPLGVIAGYLLAGVALLWAIVNKTWAPILRAAVAPSLGLGLAAIYWLPAAFERNWVDIHQATQDPGYNFENNWLFVAPRRSRSSRCTTSILHQARGSPSP